MLPVANYRPDIDGLRAIAVVSVVIFHAFPKFIRGAFFGVDIFFVISGYLITFILIRNYLKGSFSYSHFYLRRARRLFPALLTVLTVVTLLGWFLLLPDEYGRFGKHLAAGVGFVANLIFVGESGYFDLGAHEKPLLHLWSLGVEEQYYLIWPLIISIALWAKALIPGIGLVIILSFAGNILFVQQHPDAVFFLPITRIWELASGSLIAAIHFQHSGIAGNTHHSALTARLTIKGWKEWIAMLGLILLITSYYVITGREGFPGFLAVLPVSATALLILAGPATRINRYLLSSRLMVYLGAISYPLYLWHWPLLSLENIVDNGQRNRKITVMILALSLILAHVTWRWIETPVRRTRQTWPVLVLTLLLMGLGAWGWLVHLNKGYPERMPMAAQLVKWQREMALMTPGWIRHCPDALQADSATMCFAKYPPSTQTSKPGLLLVGDSHAAALAAALDDLEPFYELQVVAKGHCMPFAWMEKLENDGACHPIFQRVYAMVAANHSANSTVMLAGRWAMRFSGKGFISDETPFHFFKDVRATHGPADQGSLFERGLRETLSALTGLGRRVIFVHQIPELGFKPGSCLPRPYGLYPQHSCTIPRDVVDARQAPYRSAVTRILRDYPGVEVLDPLLLLCDAEVCRAKVDDVFMYSDDNHLSDTGARLLGHRWASQLNSPLEPRKSLSIQP